jgi:CBS domain-containing protein
MTRARDVMTAGAECVQEDHTIVEPAKQLAERGVGAMPICGNDNRLKDVLTDRDIVIRVIAEERDPASVRVRELAQGKPVTIGADDDVEEALQTMAEHKVRRLPVIDGHELVGMVSQADLARSLAKNGVGELVEAVST